MVLKKKVDDAHSNNYKLSVRCFETPEEMLARARTETPDVVYCDYLFDDRTTMDGVEALCALKRLCSKTLLFLVSNIEKSTGEKLIAEHGLHGFIDPLTEPAEWAHLLEDAYSRNLHLVPVS